MVGAEFAVTFKCSETSFAVLKDRRPRPAPYLASRGLTWIQRTDRRTLGDAELEDYLRASYALIVAACRERRDVSSDSISETALRNRP